MNSEKTLLARLKNWLCKFIGIHLPGDKWIHGNWHSYCRLCCEGIEKIDGKWYSWDESPNNPTSLLGKQIKENEL